METADTWMLTPIGTDREMLSFSWQMIWRVDYESRSSSADRKRSTIQECLKSG
jgi:hypothetical protein